VVIVVSFTTVRGPTVTPPPDTVIAVAVSSRVPVMVTGTVVPFTPVLGAIEVSVGVGGLTTVNVTALLVPKPDVTTATLRAPRGALVALAKVAVTVPSFTTATLLTVIPDPETVTPVAVPRWLPVRVTEVL